MGGWRNDRTGPTELLLQVPLRANLDIESVSADIDIDGVAPEDLDVDTVSGNVVIAAAPGSANIDSVSGDLEAPGAKVRTEEFGPGKTLETRYGSGAGEIRMESFSGDATLILE
jgi:hypothetical protein